MSMKSLVNRTKRVAALPIAAYTATAGVTTAAGSVDFANAIENKVEIQVGTITDGTHTPVIEVSSDNATWAAVNAADIVYPVGVTQLNNLASNTSQSFSYIGASRYLRVRATVAGATTGGVYGVTAQLTYRKQP